MVKKPEKVRVLFNATVGDKTKRMRRGPQTGRKESITKGSAQEFTPINPLFYHGGNKSNESSSIIKGDRGTSSKVLIHGESQVSLESLAT